jgi:hypothetical protein
MTVWPKIFVITNKKITEAILINITTTEIHSEKIK